MATPGRRKAPRAQRAPLASRRPRPRTTGTRVAARDAKPAPSARERLESLPLSSPRRRPAILAGLLVAGIATIAASTPQALTATANADGSLAESALASRGAIASAPSLADHIEDRRENAVSRSAEREALPKAEIVAGAAKATAEPEPEDDEDATDDQARTSDSGSSSDNVSGAACSSGSDVESGLTSNAIAVHRAVCAEFPSVTSYGGVRSGDGGAHGTGNALDIMVSGSTGDAIADYVRANASRLGVTEVIWAQQIWTTQRGSEGWRAMEDRGSTTANHYDHVHVTVG